MIDCVEALSNDSPQERAQDYETCLISHQSECASGCSPTIDMLRLVENPCVVNGICEARETSESCSVDCGGSDQNGVDQRLSCQSLGRENMCCGDMVCDGPENVENCQIDCANQEEGQLSSCEVLNRDERCCGDSVCDGPETASNCTADCL